MESEDTRSFSSVKIVRVCSDSKNAGRVCVLLENGLEFSVSLLESASLKSGQVLSREQVQRFCEENRFRKARTEALSFLSRRERSRREVQTHLLKKGYAKSTVSRVLKRLDEDNCLDDERFCALWIQGRQRTRPRGMHALRWELSQKGIGDETFQRHVGLIDEENAAWDAVQPRLKRWTGLDRRRFVSRAGGFLQRRGFDSNIVRKTIDRAWQALTANPSDSPDNSSIV